MTKSQLSEIQKAIIAFVVLSFFFLSKYLSAEVPFFGIVEWDSLGEKAIIVPEPYKILIIDKLGNHIKEIKVNSKLLGASISSNGKSLVYFCENDGLWIFDIDLAKQNQVDSSIIGSVKISPNGEEVVYSLYKSKNGANVEIITVLYNISGDKKQLYARSVALDKVPE